MDRIFYFAWVSRWASFWVSLDFALYFAWISRWASRGGWAPWVRHFRASHPHEFLGEIDVSAIRQNQKAVGWRVVKNGKIKCAL